VPSERKSHRSSFGSPDATKATRPGFARHNARVSAPTPVLLLMKGPPGSGKSAIARELGRRLGWPVIDKDDVRDLLPDEIGGVSYAAMLAVARHQLLLRLSVIADSPLGYAQSYREALRIAAEASARVVVVECFCSDETVWRDRIDSRRSTYLASHHTTDWQGVLDFIDRSASDPFVLDVPHLTIDTTSTDLTASTRSVLEWIEQLSPQPDPYAALKDDAWRETAEIDARLERGDIDEAGWHDALARLIVPAYLSADTPWDGSGKSGTAEDWEYARSHIGHAIDRDGSFLDIGCANGYLLECLPRWTPHAVDRYGLDIAPELVDLARRRRPELHDRIWAGNALDWEPPHRFTYIRTGLEYVPRHRRRDLVERLLAWCERLIIGVFNEGADARTTEEFLRSWGHAIAGRSERANRKKVGMDYRVLWIDSVEL